MYGHPVLVAQQRTTSLAQDVVDTGGSTLETNVRPSCRLSGHDKSRPPTSTAVEDNVRGTCVDILSHSTHAPPLCACYLLPRTQLGLQYPISRSVMLKPPYQSMVWAAQHDQ